MIITKNSPFYYKSPDVKKQTLIDKKRLIERYKQIKQKSSVNLQKREDVVKKTYRNKDWNILFQYLETEVKPMIAAKFEGEDAEVVRQLFQHLYSFGKITLK